MKTVLLVLLFGIGQADGALTPLPAGAIAGRVFGADGQPMFDSVVGLLRVVPKRGGRAIEVVDAQVTNRSGEFRLSPVLPGEYYLGATPSSLAGTEVTTLYPNAASLEAAAKIVMENAREIRNIDIRLRAFTVAVNWPE